jgi:hypothetical protein
MALLGSAWLCLDLHGFAWICLDLLGFAWRCSGSEDKTLLPFALGIGLRLLAIVCDQRSLDAHTKKLTQEMAFI